MYSGKIAVPPGGGGIVYYKKNCYTNGALYTGCLMKNALTHNFFIYYPISMNKKIKDMVFQALQNSPKIYIFFLRYLQ
jgi:hypothetical protein